MQIATLLFIKANTRIEFPCALFWCVYLVCLWVGSEAAVAEVVLHGWPRVSLNYLSFASILMPQE